MASSKLAQIGGSGIPVDEAAAASGLTVEQIVEVAREFKAAGDHALAIAGDGLIGQASATAAIAAVEALNVRIGSKLVHNGVSTSGRTSYFSQIRRLVGEIQSGRVDSVVILGQIDPIQSLPQSSGIETALRKASFVAVIAPMHTETAGLAHLTLPSTTFLEEWTDTEPAVIPSTASITGLCQPVVDTRFVLSSDSKEPWMQPRPFADIARNLMERMGHGGSPLTSRDRLKASLPSRVAFDDIMAGPANYSTPTPNSSQFRAPMLPKPSTPAANPGTYQLILYPHIYRFDGRHTSLPWLEEIPDPMSMAVWNNWLEINAGVAHRLGIRTGDIVRVDTGAGSVELPALPSQGIHTEALAIPMGWPPNPQFSGDRINKSSGNVLTALPVRAETSTGALAYGLTSVTIAKVRDARAGYDASANTLVILEDRPGGQEPEAVKDLIHTTAREHARV